MSSKEQNLNQTASDKADLRERSPKSKIRMVIPVIPKNKILKRKVNKLKSRVRSAGHLFYAFQIYCRYS